MDTRPQMAMDALRRIVQAARLSSAQCERASGLTSAQVFILKHLAEHPGVSINDLANETLTHQSTVSEVVGRLEAKGLLRRDVSTEDARRRELNLTAAGIAAIATPVATIQEILMGALTALDNYALDSLVIGLDKLIKAAGLSAEAPAMLMEDQIED